ncbi:MAG: hypothetical protein AAF825_03740 [Pseudomonadota bacterium]
MLKAFKYSGALALCLCLSAPLEAQQMRQFFAQTATPLDQITRALGQGMGPDVVITPGAGSTLVSYTGQSLPPGLAAFLAQGLPQLDPAMIAPGQAVQLSLVLTEQDAGTEIALMLIGRFEVQGAPVLSGGQVVLDGLGPEPCTGQLIVQHDQPPAPIAARYQEALEQDGFTFEDAQDDTSFFIGSRTGCEVALYVQGEEGGTTAVIRYLNE